MKTFVLFSMQGKPCLWTGPVEKLPSNHYAFEFLRSDQPIVFPTSITEARKNPHLKFVL